MSYLLREILSPNLPQSDLIAVKPNWQRADFNRQVLGLSHQLKSQSIQNLAIYLEDGAWFACVVLASWHAGVRVWLIPNLSENQILWAELADGIWTDNADLLARSAKARDIAQLLDFKEIDKEIDYDANEDYLLNPASEILLKTSGSSGEAQIITKTLAQLESEAQVLARSDFFKNIAHHQNQNLTVVSSVTPQHLYGLTFRFAWTLTMGWTISRQQSVFPEDLWANTHEAESVVWVSSPAILNRLSAERDYLSIQNKVLAIISSGGALPEPTAQFLQKHLQRPHEIYGSTETGVIAGRRETKDWQVFESVEISQNEMGVLSVKSAWLPEIFHTSDLIEYSENSNTFQLLGRQDRVIKWEDKRISLAQIEQELWAHEWVKDVHCAPYTGHSHLGIWIALNDLGIRAWREQGRVAVVAHLKKYLARTQDKIAIPRYWRFACELPRNAQSKIMAQDFQAILNQMQTTPIWQKIHSEQENTDSYQGVIPLDLVYFSGHFASFPLVAGVVILQWIQDLVSADYEWTKYHLIRIENLKFQQFIQPNDMIYIELKYDSDKQKCTFQVHNQNQKICASGRMVFGEFI